MESLFEQAKEMEKEQIKDAFIFSKDPFGLSIGNSHTIKKAEDYYNTTFKSEPSNITFFRFAFSSSSNHSTAVILF